MSSWLLIVIGAYFILALVNLADKFLIDNVVKSSRAYTFLVGTLGGLVFLAAPWFLHWPNWNLFWLNLLVGALFPLALLFLYRALKRGEASKVIVLIGGAIPIFSLLLARLFLAENFNLRQLIAVGLLILGTIIIAWLPPRRKFLSQILSYFKLKTEHQTEAIFTALGAALTFALFFVGSKFLYSHQEFLSSFIWIRLGSLLAALALLAPKSWRREIFKQLKKLRGASVKLFFANQGLAAVGFLLQNYAVALGSVTIVNALQGVQYAFLVILGALVSIFFPRLLKENISRAVIIQKIIALALIGLGLYLIALNA